jgi:hypothetical protein
MYIVPWHECGSGVEKACLLVPLNGRIICLYNIIRNRYTILHIRAYPYIPKRICEKLQNQQANLQHANECFSKKCMQFFVTKQFNIEMMGKCSGLKC